MIEARNLSKNFGDHRAVIDFSVQVAPGDVVGFLGPNGAGKTTTLRMLTGFLPATHGSVYVDGHELFADQIAVRHLVGYLPETPPLYPEMTVGGYLRFVARIKGVPRRRAGEAVERALERCKLTSVRRRILGHLSKGFRQRVGIAQSIVHDPPLLILDEPTVGLDPTQVAEIRELIADLSSPMPGAREHAVILSTHILPEVEMICRRIILMCEGRKRIDTALEALKKTGESLDRIFAREVGGEGIDTSRVSERAS